MSATGAGNDERDDEGEGGEDRSHLADVEDGCGCAEVWEHLSEQRAREERERGED